MEDEMTVEELARAWAALSEFGWAPGMGGMWGGEHGPQETVRVVAAGPDFVLVRGDDTGAIGNAIGMLPRVEDVATVGCLRAIAQKRHPGASTVRVPGGWQLMQPWPFGRDLHTHGRWGPVCELEAECYYFAMQAAP